VNVIEVSHLTKQYGNHLAVDDVSFTVADGQICGLLGPNGAGKSTIMNILTGYLSATSGQVTVAGHPLPEEADAAKACVGYLPEQPPLYPEMTVQEYLDFAAELKGIKKKADRKEQVRKAARTGRGCGHDPAAKLFVALAVIGCAAVRADHDIIGQRQRSAAAFAGTAIIFRHDFLLLYGSYWYYTPLKEKRKGENLQNSSRIIHLPLYFSIDSRYTNEVSVYKLCLLASTKDFTLFIISRGI